jgi:hypothetical protein
MGNRDSQGKTDAKAERQKRLAEALRANLKRRKAAARAADAAGSASAGAAEETAASRPDPAPQKSP